MNANYLMDVFGLSDKTAFVTGGNSGLGLSIARGLGRAGANIVIAGRNEEKNKLAQESLIEEEIEVKTVVADVTKSGEVRHAIAGAMDTYSSIDILVNSAGITMASPAHRITEPQWAEVLNVNLKGTLLCCQEAGRVMKGTTENPAKIINIAGLYGFFGGSFVAAYAASKGGVVQLTKSLAVEWARRYILVNAIVPGWFETTMTAPMRMTPDTARGILRSTPLGRFGAPDEINGTALFLASRASNFITGSCVWVDGGYSAGI